MATILLQQSIELQNGDPVMNRLKPVIKWPGGKERELEIILNNLPKSLNNFFDPFVGGGSVFMALQAKSFYINDKSSELINLYQNISDNNKDFTSWVLAISRSWSSMKDFVTEHNALAALYIQYRAGNLSESSLNAIIAKFIDDNKHAIDNVLDKKFIWRRDILLEECNRNLLRKMMRMRKIEHKNGTLSSQDTLSNIETAFLSALYMYYRSIYNDKKICLQSPLSASVFLFIRNYAYSGMFRFNSSGHFNVPYGGIGYNSKNLEDKLEYYNNEELLVKFKRTHIFCMDFEEFLTENKPGAKDFVFLDPPYDTDFSTYDQNDFGRNDQKRLADYCCNKCKAKWMLIIKNTPYIMSLYKGRGFNIRSFNKIYSVSFMNRNNRNAEHLLITNY